MPTECEHGHTVDWGDFGDPDEPYGGATPCPHCESPISPAGQIRVLRKRLGRMHSNRRLLGRWQVTTPSIKQVGRSTGPEGIPWTAHRLTKRRAVDAAIGEMLEIGWDVSTVRVEELSP